MRLGEILVHLGLLTPEQLRLVVENLDLGGGRIGTQIVERGLLDTDQIAEALGRQLALLARSDTARARELARAYLERFPHGAQAELARSLSGQP